MFDDACDCSGGQTDLCSFAIAVLWIGVSAAGSTG
jgi:hypothetical protein